MNVFAAINALGEDVIDAIRDECHKSGKDFHQLTAAKALNKPYEEVQPEERKAAKEALFTYIYSARFPIRSYEMNVGGRTMWLSLDEAGRTFDSGWVDVKIGTNVREPDGTLRPITEEEKSKIVEIADEYSANK